MISPDSTIHMFAGVAQSLPDAMMQARDGANDWLMLHQWRDTSGHSAYTLIPFCHFDGTHYTYVIHLLGPDEVMT